jgi:xanthine dehydrogenase accessory factor
MNNTPHDWLPAVATLLQRAPAVVRVVIAEARGSVPREPGAFMLVGHAFVEGTVGGGRLEWECIAAARELLDQASVAARWSRIVLAADVGQCCGGVVSVWLERFTREDLELLQLAREAGAHGVAVLSSTVRGASLERRIWAAGRVVASAAAAGPVAEDVAELLRLARPRATPRAFHANTGEVTFLERLDDALRALWLYGAGHVGQSLARILTELPLRLTWIDSRPELFPVGLPAEVRIRIDADSVMTVSDAPPGAYFLVMTHSHPLDYELVRAILLRNDFAWVGLIGSQSKAARFRSRLAREGIGPDRIARLVSPIGIGGIESKWPGAIAVAVAAQLLQEISGHAGELATEGESAAALPGADCGRESCATCGTRRVRLE